MDWLLNGFLGDIPGWIMACAVVFAYLQLRTDRERRADEIKLLKKEDERERHDLTRRLTAWVATNARDGDLPADSSNLYAIVISNASGSMFFDVEITAQLHKFGGPTPALTLTRIPPGRYFCEWEKGSNGASKWGFAKCIEELDAQKITLRPLMNTPAYRVDTIKFTDPLGDRWTVNKEGVLNETDSKPETLA